MLPPELNQIILRYAISVPDFFDPDVTDRIPSWIVRISYSDWNNLKQYWATERTRNNLRRVCRSWDSYLCRYYSHRFVSFDDVAHGLVSAQCLRSAIRI
ncbi:hypothetical protein CPB86DRAFT_693256, partial [Serendipita vermifera]